MRNLLANPKVATFIEWYSTIAVIIGALCLSFDYATMSKIGYLTGSIGWVLVGIVWKKHSVIIVNVVITLIFFAGYLK
jgi:hypothetical protein